eukprot:gene8395-10297_t
MRAAERFVPHEGPLLTASDAVAAAAALHRLQARGAGLGGAAVSLTMAGDSVTNQVFAGLVAGLRREGRALAARALPAKAHAEAERRHEALIRGRV